MAAALFRFRFDTRVICLLLPFLLLFAVHSVYESHERYHMPAVPFLVVLGSMLSIRRSNPATEWEPLATWTNQMLLPPIDRRVSPGCPKSNPNFSGAASPTNDIGNSKPRLYGAPLQLHPAPAKRN